MMKMGHISALVLLLLPVCTLVIGTSIKDNNHGLYEMIISNHGPGMIKKGSCPPQRYYPLAENEVCHQICKTDANCDGDQKCCPDNCHHICKPPVKHKPGICPTFESALASSKTCKDFCTTDGECSGNLKCCQTACGRSCMSTLSDIGKPSMASTARDGFCSQEEKYPCVRKEMEFCNAQSCLDGYKCCPVICRMQCQKALQERAGECPASTQCPPEAESKACSSDYDCQNFFKCCATCGNRCVKALNIPSFLRNGTLPVFINGGK